MFESTKLTINSPLLSPDCQATRFQVFIDSLGLVGKTQSSFAPLPSPFQRHFNVRKLQLEHLFNIDPLKLGFTVL
jgi:hypothetical protein